MSGADNTSGRVKQTPGGNSTFSFGWGEEKKETEEERQKREEAARKKKEEDEISKKKQEEGWKKACEDARPDPRGRAPPGGQSSISFG